MFEALTILTLLFVGAIVVGVLALLAGLLKVVLKLVLALVVVGPVVVGLGLLLFVPLLILGGLVWAGVAIVT
jgi:hypothetical protein